MWVDVASIFAFGLSHVRPSGDLGRYLPGVRAVAAVLEAGAGAAGNAIQDSDLVELAGLALAGDANHPFTRTVDRAETTAGAGQ
jgi:hypothetical protein